MNDLNHYCHNPIVLLQRIERSSQQITFFNTCFDDDQSSSSYGVIMMHASIAVLQIVGLYLVHQSKHVTSIPSLNETKPVTALIYFSTICFGVIVFIGYQLKGFLNISQAIKSVFYLVLVFLFLGLVFGPKVKITPLLAISKTLIVFRNGNKHAHSMCCVPIPLSTCCQM